MPSKLHLTNSRFANSQGPSKFRNFLYCPASGSKVPILADVQHLWQSKLFVFLEGVQRCNQRDNEHKCISKCMFAQKRIFFSGAWLNESLSGRSPFCQLKLSEESQIYWKRFFQVKQQFRKQNKTTPTTLQSPRRVQGRVGVAWSSDGLIKGQLATPRALLKKDLSSSFWQQKHRAKCGLCFVSKMQGSKSVIDHQFGNNNQKKIHFEIFSTWFYKNDIHGDARTYQVPLRVW